MIRTHVFKRPSAERTSPEYQRGAMCVQQFDDSLNSAIRNTMSHFATVFIDVRAKGSTVGSCSFSILQNFHTQPTDKTKNKPTKTIVHGQPEKRRAQPPSAHKRSDTRFLTRTPLRTKTGGTQTNRNGNINDPSAGSPTETLLRLLLPLTDQVGTVSRRIPGDRCRPPGLQSKVLAKPVNR